MAKNHKSLVVAELITYSCQLIQSCSKQLSKVFFYGNYLSVTVFDEQYHYLNERKF